MSIRILVYWSTHSKMIEKYGRLPRLYDCSKLVYRAVETRPLHLNRHKERTVNDVLSTLACKREEFPPVPCVYIILDDIITSGCSMDACKELLVRNGLSENGIVQLALAHTKR